MHVRKYSFELVWGLRYQTSWIDVKVPNKRKTWLLSNMDKLHLVQCVSCSNIRPDIQLIYASYLFAASWPLLLSVYNIRPDVLIIYVPYLFAASWPVLLSVYLLSVFLWWT